MNLLTVATMETEESDRCGEGGRGEGEGGGGGVGVTVSGGFAKKLRELQTKANIYALDFRVHEK